MVRPHHRRETYLLLGLSPEWFLVEGCLDGVALPPWHCNGPYTELLFGRVDLLLNCSLRRLVPPYSPWLVIPPWRSEEGGGDLVPTMHVCVCRKVKDIGPFSASGE